MIEAGVPTLLEVHEIIPEFQMMIRRKAAFEPCTCNTVALFTGGGPSP
jgi:hypothetical protein